MSHGVTMSKIEVAMACPGGFALPQTGHRNQFQEAGNKRHKESEDAINAGDIPDWLTERWPGLTWRAEVKLAYDISTGEGRELGVGGDRNYGDAGVFEIPGTADIVGTGPGRLVIADIKSNDPSVSPPSRNRQLHINALAAARAHGVTEVTVALKHEIRGVEVHEMDGWELEEFAGLVRATLVTVAQQQLAAREGKPLIINTNKGCRWCDAFNDCPKQQDVMALVKSDAIDMRVQETIPFRDDEAAADAYELADKIRMVLKRLDAAIYARASERPIPLRNGKLFGRITKLGDRKLDGKLAHKVIWERYGRDIADLAVELSATQTKIEAALKVAKVKSVAGEKEAVLAALDKLGGIKRAKKTEIDEYEPQRQLRAANE